MKLISTWLLGVLSLWFIVLLPQTQVAHPTIPAVKSMGLAWQVFWNV
ncbi:MAG: hypothetical protein O3A71_09900 [Proteobacteria bacterium]|nr:hypothetical protein [Pseudomonadota bacterium]